MNRLPTFKGWAVDNRLKQFRKGNPTEGTFLDFDSEKGHQLLAAFIDTLDKTKQQD